MLKIKMIRRRYLIIVFLIVLFFIAIFIGKDIMENNEVCAGNYCFLVEIADNPEERSRGLMNRESLDSDKGMLFIFDQESRHYFWMKNTLIPLDMIWIDKNKEVVHIEKNIQPCQTDPCPVYGPDKEAKYVLEINVGQSDQAKIQIGDKLSFE